MFWRERERERESKDQNGGPPVGQVRVLVVGDSGNSMSLVIFMVLFNHFLCIWIFHLRCCC